MQSPIKSNFGKRVAEPVPFTAAVLAGGRSRRMGTDKAFLSVGDELLIQRQLRCLQETGPADILISGQIGSDYSRFDTRVIFDEQHDCGPLAGIAALLKAASCSRVLVLAVDMPAMTTAMLLKIISRSTEGVGCVPVDDHGFQPLAAIYPISTLSLVEQHLAAASYSMEAFVSSAIDADLLRPLFLENAEAGLFANWNRPNDWIAFPG